MQPFKYKPKTNTGDLRHRIDIYDNVKVVNEYFETTYKFQKVNTIWASLIPQTGSLQRQESETILTNVTHKIVVRYPAGKDITKDMQIFQKDENDVVHRYEIKYILNPFFKNETLEIFCQELID